MEKSRLEKSFKNRRILTLSLIIAVVIAVAILLVISTQIISKIVLGGGVGE